MIVIRESFTAKPGKASALAALFLEVHKGIGTNVRVLTDLVGTFNTVVIESTYESVSVYEKEMLEHAEKVITKLKAGGYHDLFVTGKREIYLVKE